MTNPSLSTASSLPFTLLGALHRATFAAVSPETAVQILRDSGVETARGVLASFSDWCAAARMDSTPVQSLAEGEFWSLLSEFFMTQGWGALEYEKLHPGVVAISSDRWVEAGAGTGEEGLTCHFTTGLFAELIRLIADSEVAVLEVECRSGGSESCRFLIGSPAVLDTIYSHLLSGSDVADAVSALV